MNNDGLLLDQKQHNNSLQQQNSLPHIDGEDMLTAFSNFLDSDQTNITEEPLPSPTHADTQNLSPLELCNRITELYEQGYIGKATEIARTAIDQMQNPSVDNHNTVSSIYNNLALLLHSQGEYEEAELLYRRAIKHDESRHGEEDLSVAIDLANLGALLEMRGSCGQAETVFRRALDIKERVHGENHREIVTELSNLGQCLTKQNKHEEAEPLFIRALDISRRTLGPGHPAVVTIMNSLADVYSAQKKYQPAGAILEQAVQIRKSALLPRKDIAIASCLLKIGDLFIHFGDAEISETEYRRALCMLESMLGKDHPIVIYCLDKLTESLLKQNKFSEADEARKRACEIKEELMKSSDPLDAIVELNNRAGLLQAQGKFIEAERICKRIVALAEKECGELSHVTIKSLCNLAALYQVQGKFRTAEILFHRVLDTRTKTCGEEDSSLVPPLLNLAHIAREQNRVDEAAGLFQHALRVAQNATPDDHATIELILKNLLDLYHAAGKQDEAAAAESRLANIYRDREHGQKVAEHTQEDSHDTR